MLDENDNAAKSKLEEKAMKLYNQTLHNLKWAEKRNMYSDGLARSGKDMFGSKFIGVFSRDTLPDIPNNHYAIVNNKKQSQEGEHWIALAHLDGDLVAYDSFGRSSKKLLNDVPITKDTDHDAEQKDSQNDCGNRCLAWLRVVYKMGKEAALTI